MTFLKGRNKRPGPNVIDLLNPLVSIPPETTQPIIHCTARNRQKIQCTFSKDFRDEVNESPLVLHIVRYMYM